MYRIDIDTKKLTSYLYKNGIILKKYPAAVGKKSTPTQKGHWKIIKKGLWGAQFGGHFMQLSIPYGIYGIHGTDIPSSVAHAVSHGCVRMYSRDAKEIYSIINLGTPVNIY
jgi:hypothetical protein